MSSFVPYHSLNHAAGALKPWDHMMEHQDFPCQKQLLSHIHG